MGLLLFILIFIDMKKRLIITESQLTRLKAILKESAVVSIIVKKIKNELDRNYTPVMKVVRKGGEYFEKPMIMIKADEEVITGKEARDYIKHKLGYNDTNYDNLIKQAIIDWANGAISDDYSLTKNIAIT
jgi:hypothetical protein